MVRALVLVSDGYGGEFDAVMLRMDGHDVTEATDADGAWSVLEKGGVELLMVDPLLPSLDGYRLYARVRNDSHFDSLPIVM